MSNTAQIAIVMGSKSDWATMQEATQILDELNVAYHVEVVSASNPPTNCLNLLKMHKKWLQSDYCRCRWCGTPTRYDCSQNACACTWGAC